MISIVIPTYEQNGVGAKMLQELFNSIARQRFNYPYEVCVSDNSTDNNIMSLCSKQSFPIRYKMNPIRGASENINSAIEMASFNYIKLMCMDDVFKRPNAMNLFVEGLFTHGWVIANSVRLSPDGTGMHLVNTKYDHNQFDTNITGMPSVIAWRKNELRFDVRLKTFCDMYFYYQLYEKYGAPKIIKEYIIGQRYHPNSYSRTHVGAHDQDRNFLRTNNMIKC